MRTLFIITHPQEEPEDDLLWGLWKRRRSQFKRELNMAPKSPNKSCPCKGSYLVHFLCNCFPRWPLLSLGSWKQHSTSPAQLSSAPSYRLELHLDSDVYPTCKAGVALPFLSPLPDAAVLEEVTRLSDSLATWRAPWAQLSFEH